MVTIPLRARLNPDGALDVHVPTGLPEAEVDVLVIVQPASRQATGWPAGFFEETYGAFADDPLERPPQGQLDAKEILG
jgi:hypothetical protein